MTKWKCSKCGCVKSPCVLETGTIPHLCPLFCLKTPEWEIQEEPAPTATTTGTLPKLTAEIFDRPDCPGWATCAFVEKDGNAFYSSAVHMAVSDKGECWGGSDFQDENLFLRIEGKWDATDWQNSLIKRSAKLPDWCKVGEWIYNHTEKREYAKIIKIDPGVISLDCFSYTAIGEDVLAKEYVPARLRPYNAEELKALVGKVIESKDKVDCLLVTAYNSGEELDDVAAVMTLGEWVNAEELLRIGYTIDGKPCGVLEHLNDNGEWVE